jgi:hypothetical protein
LKKINNEAYTTSLKAFRSSELFGASLIHHCKSSHGPPRKLIILHLLLQFGVAGGIGWPVTPEFRYGYERNSEASSPGTGSQQAVKQSGLNLFSPLETGWFKQTSSTYRHKIRMGNEKMVPNPA